MAVLMQNTPWTSLLLLFSLEICNFYPKKKSKFSPGHEKPQPGHKELPA